MDKLKKIIEQYLVPIIVIMIILYFFFGDRTSDSGKKIEQYYINNQTNADTYYKNNEFEIHGTNTGYDIYNKGLIIGSIIGEKEIINFINSLKKDGLYNLPIINNIESGNNIGIIIDNTYSEWNHTIDTNLPENTFNLALNDIRNNNYITGGTKGQIGWLFSDKYGTPEAHMNNESYSFEINPFKIFTTIYASGNIKSNNNLQYSDGNNKLIIKNIELNMYSGKDNSNCKNVSENGYEFICADKENFIEKVKSIYEGKYKKDDMHKGTNLIDYLYTKGFYNLKDIYIFTDGEFQISNETSKAFLKKTNYEYKLSNTLEFNINEYENNKDYKKYRLSVSEILNSNITKCNNNNLIFVGLTSNSAPFIEFTKEIYAKIFEGCSLSFKS